MAPKTLLERPLTRREINRRSYYRHHATNSARTRAYQQTPAGRAAWKAGCLNTRAKRQGAAGRVSGADILALPAHCPCGATHALEVDHVVPLRNGGRNDADNVQVLCRQCHRAKTRAGEGRPRTVDPRVVADLSDGRIARHSASEPVQLSLL